MIFSFAAIASVRSWAALAIGVALLAMLAGCSSQNTSHPRELLLRPEDAPGLQLAIVAESEQESEEGPSALIEMQGADFRVLQSVVLFESRELALSALDGIRGDLVSRGVTGPGTLEASGILEHNLGSDEASSLFFIEGKVLVRLTVTGPERRQLLDQLAGSAREKIAAS